MTAVHKGTRKGQAHCIFPLPPGEGKVLVGQPVEGDFTAGYLLYKPR